MSSAGDHSDKVTLTLKQEPLTAIFRNHKQSQINSKIGFALLSAWAPLLEWIISLGTQSRGMRFLDTGLIHYRYIHEPTYF